MWGFQSTKYPQIDHILPFLSFLEIDTKGSHNTISSSRWIHSPLPTPNHKSSQFPNLMNNLRIEISCSPASSLCGYNPVSESFSNHQGHFLQSGWLTFMAFGNTTSIFYKVPLQLHIPSKSIRSNGHRRNHKRLLYWDVWVISEFWFIDWFDAWHFTPLQMIS